jgi:hypothetical protein
MNFVLCIQEDEKNNIKSKYNDAIIVSHVCNALFSFVDLQQITTNVFDGEGGVGGRKRRAIPWTNARIQLTIDVWW